MAGSRKWFVYTDSDAREWAIQQDESNGEQVGNADYTDTDLAVIDELPRNIKPRYALFRSADGRISRKIVICSNTATISTLANTINVTDGNGGATVQAILTSFQGERRTRIPFDLDTGLTDGDAT